jgi:uncharacterized membrane protein YphA (DoxX/SURF4 family)
MESAASITLGVVWLAASLLKARHFRRFSGDVQTFLPGPARLLAAVVLAVEACLGLCLVSHVARPVPGYVSVVFLIVETGSFVLRAGRTSELSCGCFGRRGAAPTGPATTRDGQPLLATACAQQR